MRRAKNESCWHFWRSELTSKGTENGLKSNATLYFKKRHSSENTISFRFFQCQLLVHIFNSFFPPWVWSPLLLWAVIAALDEQCKAAKGKSSPDRFMSPPPSTEGALEGWLSRHVFIWLATVTWHLWNQSIPILTLGYECLQSVG